MIWFVYHYIARRSNYFDLILGHHLRSRPSIEQTHNNEGLVFAEEPENRVLDFRSGLGLYSMKSIPLLAP